VWGQYAAAARIDAKAAADYFASGGAPRGSGLGHAATAFAWGGGKLGDSWPAAAEEETYRRLRTSDVETLLVGGELDFATPPQNARQELLPYLPNGQEVLLPGFGHTLSFWHEQPEAGTHLINTYLDSGEVDSSYYIPQEIDFTQPLGFGGVAKIVLASLLGLVALAVTTLLLMWRRVHRRGSFGRKAAVALRVLAPAVLGLGGWLAAALVVLTALPGVPLDHELLGALSIGLPVGLGVYLAWVNRAWTARTKAIGLAAAAAGALVGAWLGFNVTEDLVAVFTTIAGAALGGNLALLALDIAWDRQAHDRFADTPAAEALLARPTTG